MGFRQVPADLFSQGFLNDFVLLESAQGFLQVERKRRPVGAEVECHVNSFQRMEGSQSARPGTAISRATMHSMTST